VLKLVTCREAGARPGRGAGPEHQIRGITDAGGQNKGPDWRRQGEKVLQRRAAQRPWDPQVCGGGVVVEERWADGRMGDVVKWGKSELGGSQPRKPRPALAALPISRTEQERPGGLRQPNQDGARLSSSAECGLTWRPRRKPSTVRPPSQKVWPGADFRHCGYALRSPGAQELGSCVAALCMLHCDLQAPGSCASDMSNMAYPCQHCRVAATPRNCIPNASRATHHPRRIHQAANVARALGSACARRQIAQHHDGRDGLPTKQTP